MTEFWHYLNNDLLSECDLAKKKWVLANIGTREKADLYIESLLVEEQPDDYLDIDVIKKTYNLFNELLLSIENERELWLKWKRLESEEKDIEKVAKVSKVEEVSPWYFGK